MLESVATCTACGADAVERVDASSAFWHDGRLVVVQDIPALRCARCGEQYYDDATTVALDLLRGRGFDPDEACAVISVPVFSLMDAIGYSAAAEESQMQDFP
ncbi:MAG TPA: YgiT-type zinc finger protein [Ramlibacter sp.]|jgi:YgiT-type zinc finger domain-containing protein